MQDPPGVHLLYAFCAQVLQPGHFGGLGVMPVAASPAELKSTQRAKMIIEGELSGN